MIRFLIVIALFLPAAAEAETYLVENGQSLAEIIIAEDPPRSVHLAARELQTYVEKIAGAQMTIGAESIDRPIRIYVGESPHTGELGIKTDDLKYGAYRIVSGEDWLVLIGQDSDFAPIEPWPRGYQDIRSGKMQAAWDKITGAQWGYTHSQLHKHYSGPNSLFGTPNERKTDEEGNVHVWTYDERGSFNAVCGFLRDLGVVDFENQAGFWLHEMLISRGNALAAAGQNDEATKSFRRVTEDKSALETHRKRAAEALAANSRQQ